MGAWVLTVFDTTGFVPRKECGAWTPGLVWLHAGSDIFIWLAYLAIPLAILYFTRRRSIPFPGLFGLAAAFILACGTTHLLDAIMFERPMYRLAGAVKGVTAVVSWATVFALIVNGPRLWTAIDRADAVRAGDPFAGDRPTGGGRFVVAVLAAALAVGCRAALDPIMQGDHAFVVPLLAVVFASWYGGFWPGVTALAVGMLAVIYLFVEPRNGLIVERLNDQLAVGLFAFAGVACATIGEAQWVAWRRAERAVADLTAANRALDLSQRRTAEALAQLDAFLAHAPVGIAFFDPDLRFVRINETLAAAHGVPAAAHLGRTVTEVLPDYPRDLLAALRGVLDTGEPVADRPARTGDVAWLVSAHPVPGADGRTAGLVATAVDVTERQAAEQSLRESEDRFRTLADTMPQIVWVTRPDGYHEYYNRRWFEYTGCSEAESIGWGWAAPLHPDDKARSEARWRHATATGEPYEIEYRFRGADGNYRWFLGRALPMRGPDGAVRRWFGTCTDIHAEKLAKEELAGRARLAALRADVAAALAAGRPVRDTLQACAETLVRYADAALARVWTADPAGTVLDLQASAGVCSVAEGLYVRVRFGEWKIGRIAAAAHPLTTNDFPNDPNAADPEWARRERLVGFAGYPLAVDGRVVGVLALYARHPLSAELLADLGPIAEAVAQYVDRKRAEDAARDAAEQLATMADSIPQLAWMARPDGHLFWYNRRWYEYTGTTPAEMEGWGWQKVHDPAELPRVVEKFKACLAAGTPWEDTFPLRRHDGAMRWYLSRARPIRDAAGNVVRWFGTNTDVTELRDLERALRDSAARFQALTESLPQLVWTCAPDGRCDYLSRQWVEYTGVPEADQLGYGWTAAVHPDDRAAATAAWQAAVAAGAVFDCEFRIRSAAGEYRWFKTRGMPTRGADGAVVKWVGTNTDIDDQKRQAERLEDLVRARTAALTEQQQFLDAILANVADGIVACGPDGTLKLFNAAAREFHGLPAEPLPPDRWADRYDLFEPDGSTRLPTDRIPLTRALRGERVRDAEMVVRPAGGAERYLLASGQPLADAAGRNLGAVVSMRDITERRRAEVRLQRFAKELERSNGELEKFAYVASHDLQEPLRKIQAFGDRLAKKYRDTLGDQGQEYVDRMLASAGRMRTLIDDLLAFSRVATKARPFARVDLAAVARDAVSDLEDRVARTGGRVEVGGLPTVQADPVQMRQIFQNLIGNALKFHAPDRPPVVTVGAHPAGNLPPDADPPPPRDGWRIVVADNGIGFEQQYADRVFEVFQRLHGRDQYEGTGIGLAICKKIVERHGGTIAAKSQPGVGTRIIIDLPASAGTETPA